MIRKQPFVYSLEILMNDNNDIDTFIPQPTGDKKLDTSLKEMQKMFCFLMVNIFQRDIALVD